MSHQNIRFQVRGHALATGESRTKLVYNVYDFFRTSGTGAPSKTTCITAFKTNILTPLAACLSVSYVTDFIDCRFLDDPLDPYLTQALSLSGTITGDSLPSLNNAYVQLGTGQRLGSNRGAKHFGPLAESSTTLDQLTSGAQTLFAAFCTALLAGFSDGSNTWLPFLVSQKKSTLKATTAVVVGSTITTAITRPVLGMMKKRAEFRRASV